MEEYQKELFHNLYSDKRLKKKRLKKNLFVKNNIKVNLSYEQLSLFIIVFVVLLSVVFTLGVERGKRLSGKLIPEYKVDNTKNVGFSKEEGSEKKVESTSKDEKSKILGSKKASAEYFTIQVVTYKKDSLVESELKYLKKRGYDAFVIKSGKNNKHICIGKFKNKNESGAKEAFGQLKKRYKDCFIKRVKSEM